MSSTKKPTSTKGPSVEDQDARLARGLEAFAYATGMTREDLDRAMRLARAVGALEQAPPVPPSDRAEDEPTAEELRVVMLVLDCFGYRYDPEAPSHRSYARAAARGMRRT